MANYPISKINKGGTLLRPKGSYCSDEYVENMCDLYLRDEIHRMIMESYTSIIVSMQNSPTIWRWFLLMISIARNATAVC